MIQCDMEGSVAVLRMEHGKVNAIDTELFQALQQELDRLKKSSIASVVLTGSGNTFSAGVNLYRILQDGADYVHGFVPVLSSGLEKLFQFPKPVVAAINGHAIAGGCIIACACDYRIMADGPSRIGVPELLVGVPFPPIALEIMRFVAPPQHFQEIIYTGAVYSPEEGMKRGLIDETVPSARVLERACEIARQLGAVPPNSFQSVKQMIRLPTRERAKKLAAQQETILELWKDPEIHAAIRKYMERTVGKKTHPT